jgi:hypothetical protein
MPPNYGIRPNDGKRLAGLRKLLADPSQKELELVVGAQ